MKGAVNEHLIHVLEKSTPYQRMVWLEKAFEFWKILQKENLKIGREKT